MGKFVCSIKSEKDLGLLKDGNEIRGSFPLLMDSEIRFVGKNNIIYCEDGVVLQGSAISFNGSDSVVYLGRSKAPYKIGVFINNASAFHMGKNNGMTQKVKFLLSEGAHCFVGDDCLFSYGITFRNADAHLIYNVETMKRVNISRSIFVGDHVWIGQDCLILKGTQVGSGCVIGGMSVVSSKKIPNNQVWAGNPAKKISENIFWDRSCVHEWQKDKTEISMDYADFNNVFLKSDDIESWIYRWTEGESIDFNYIEARLTELRTSEGKCDFLVNLNSSVKKNRFVRRSADLS